MTMRMIVLEMNVEIFKFVNNLNPDFMSNMFTTKQNARVWSHDLIIRNHNDATYDGKLWEF